MTAALTDEQVTRIAKARVGFRIHALVYLVVNLFLVAIWFLTTRVFPQATATPTAPDFWPIWPELAWGVGLLVHGFVVYAGGLDWQKREEEKLRKRLGGTP